MYMRVINVSCDHVSSVAISPGHIAQSVARLTQEQRSSIRYSVRLHTFVYPFVDSTRAVKCISYWQKYGHLVLVNRLGGLSLSRTRTVRKSDYTPTLALSRHMASAFDEKCTEKQKGILNRRKPIPSYNKFLSIYTTNFYPTIHIVFVIL